MWVSLVKFFRYKIPFETWFLVLCVATLVVGFFAYPWVKCHETLSAGIVGVVFATWFSFVNYRISKDKLFKELFTELNARYDRMNEDLNSIYKTGRPTKKTGEIKESKEVIIDYLILCSEEYMWYRKRRITEEVWNNWKSGIEYFFKNELFKKVLLEEEAQKESYYELFDELQNSNEKKMK